MTTRLALRGQLAYMRAQGLQVTAVASPGWDLEEAGRQESVPIVAISMQREVSPVGDLVSLVRLIRLFRQLRPEIVHAGTPKASLLGMIAAWLTRVPVRIYAVKGLRLETVGGWKRHLLWLTERITGACATRIFCEGPDLARIYVRQGLAKPEKLVVFGSGMLNGLDAARFHPAGFSPAATAALRTSLGIPADAFVIGFVGRFVRDKGLVELSAAFEQVRRNHPQAHLLLVGDFEAGDPLPADCRRHIESQADITRTGFVADTAPYYQLMDLHVLPSYREGFPNSPMEAAAAGIPTVGFVATGMSDAVLHEETGLLVPCGDAAALAQAIERYVADSALLNLHGHAAQQRVIAEFAPEPIWAAIFAEYARLLRAAGVELPTGATADSGATAGLPSRAEQTSHY